MRAVDYIQGRHIAETRRYHLVTAKAKTIIAHVRRCKARCAGGTVKRGALVGYFAQ